MKIEGNNRRPVVLVVQRRLTHYRVEFFERLKAVLAEQGIEFRLAYGAGSVRERSKSDSGVLSWAHEVPTRYLFGDRICLQAMGALLDGVDLVVITHENKLIYNLYLQYFRPDLKVVLWGHGANLQGEAASIREHVKSFTARRADWWLGYTAMSVPVIERTGFPRDRITVLNNATDTKQLNTTVCSITPGEVDELRRQLGLKGGNVGVFVGSLYAEKRIDFMLEAALRIRKTTPDFEFLIIGAGPEQPLVEAFCAKNSWTKFLGVRHGDAKVRAICLARVMLNPGLVGLGVLDSFVCGVPMVTTDCGLHSPEICYLKDRDNGLVSANAMDDFVQAVREILEDEALLKTLKIGCTHSAQTLTLDNMVGNFAKGINDCLSSPSYRGRRRGGKRLADDSGTKEDDQRPRVLMFHPALPPYRLDLFNQLAARTRLRIVFLNEHLLEQELDQGTLRGRLRVNHAYLTRGFRLFGRIFRYGLLKEIKTFKPDVVVTTEYSPTSVAVAVIKRLGFRSYRHVIWSDDNEFLVKQDLIVRRLFRRALLLGVDGLVLLSERVGEVYRRKFGFSGRYASVAIMHEEEEFTSALGRSTAEVARLFAQHDLTRRKVILYVGRMVSVKRVDRIVDAFARVRVNEPDAMLVLVGTGPLLPALATQARMLGIEDSLIFAGHCEGDRLGAWYRLGDAFVLASQRESFGAVVNEALLTGMPVLCSHRAGASVLIENGVNGHIVDAANADSLADHLTQLLVDVTPRADPGSMRPTLMRHRFSESVESFVALLDGRQQMPTRGSAEQPLTESRRIEDALRR